MTPRYYPFSIFRYGGIVKRRHFLLGSAVTALTSIGAPSLGAQSVPPNGRAEGPLKIEAVEVIELHGSYTRKPASTSSPR